jgi:transcriptional regulator with XRE-family HTH domain
MRSLPVAFGKTVRRLRAAQGFSQEKFAAKARISRTYMSEIERGVTGVSLESVARIARALDMAMSALLKQVEDTR